MKSISPRVDDERLYVDARSANPGSGKSVMRTIWGKVGRLIPERWLFDLFALALFGFLMVGISVYGLAVVSTWIPQIQPIFTPMPGDREDGDGGIAIRKDLILRQETR